MENNRLKQMMKGALLLSLAAFVTKILSAVYRVPFQNMVGNTGFYVYQQVYPIYGIGMTFALSGFPVFLSKMIAETADSATRQRMMRRSLVILGGFGFSLFLGIYGFSSQLAQLMGDPDLKPILQSVSWMFLWMPLLATLRGYFQGNYRMEPTAVSQVSEQLVRVGAILIAAYLYTKTKGDLYVMGANAMSGATIGAVLASSILLGAYQNERRQNAAYALDGQQPRKADPAGQWGILVRRYATEGMTICLLSAILVLFQLIDSFTLYNGLLDGGAASDLAKNVKGVYDRGQPLVQLGMVVGTGFSASFIPLMSQAHAQGRQQEFVRSAVSLLRMTSVFSAAAVTGLLAILPNVNNMLFGDREGIAVLSVYILAIFAASVMTAYQSILQSLGRYKISLAALAVALAVKFCGNLLLVKTLGTMGASIALIAGLGAMLLLLWLQSERALRDVWFADKFLLKLMIGCVVLFVTAGSLRIGLERYVFMAGGRLADSAIAAVTVCAGVAVFLWYILKAKLFTLREWISIPFGKKLLRKLPDRTRGLK
ncbi:putative polysaccharide biosynthesis protein [Trichococcus ilyis]|uniref:Polysaccharide biosynthesis protein n=1 Tax=Trichococcus ilyis TaxID=640938 RepID=A0A143Z3H2_9LACT|nr:oligosaccharide flippase family protein [Trichococcus ilyis]CZR03564.1 polysaccharide biosynthesis protein [Trichococcus ilyis]SEJ42901.1 polysaccharide transporter, PST family [Trichococcus ilyis]